MAVAVPTLGAGAIATEESGATAREESEALTLELAPSCFRNPFKKNGVYARPTDQ
jgi:hypothetical protein